MQRSEALTEKRTATPSPLGQYARGFLTQLAFFIGGLLIFALLWIAASSAVKDLPKLKAIWEAAQTLFQNPWYDHGPSDKGILNLMLNSLSRVASGFALGALVAIPLGTVMGMTPFFRKLLDPLVQLLRPVSPLAWYPLGLAAFTAADPALIFTIFITALWPTVLNTAFGVSSLPQDFKNVARVFRFTPWQYLTRVVMPFALPSIVTGLRISFGIAWMVIVAAEMLSGRAGIGFFVWDSYNAGNLALVVVAILLIGFTGYALDRLFGLLERRVSFK